MSKSKNTTTPSPVNEDQYNAFIRDLQICKLTFPSVSWKLIELPPKDMKLRDEVALEINEPLISEDHTEVTIPATLTVWAKGEGKEEPFMEISMHQHLTITINPEHFSEEILQAYIVRNAVLNLVSVFREHVKYATFQMGLPPLILPAFKITPPGKENESQEGADTDAP